MDTVRKLQRIGLIIASGLLSCLLPTEVMAMNSWPSFLAPSFDAGIMIGYTGGPRKGVIVNPATGGSEMNSGSQDSSEIGVQMRLLFGSEYNARPFFYLNGTRPIGSAITILLGKDLPPFTNTTKLTLTNNWLTRFGLGGVTPWLYDRFQLGAGAAVVVMSQTLETYLGQAKVSTFNQNKTSVRPSVMGNITWSLCPKCLMGHESLLTAQITADNNPVINGSVPSEVGPLNTRVHQAWVPRGDLIFSISFS